MYIVSTIYVISVILSLLSFVVLWYHDRNTVKPLQLTFGEISFFLMFSLVPILNFALVLTAVPVLTGTTNSK